MSKYWSDTAHRLTPYVPGEQPKTNNLIKLNTNENPYPPSPKALEHMRSAVNDNVRLYSDPNCSELKQAIAKWHRLDPSQVTVGNGSDEVLGHLFQALLKHDKPLLFPDITYGLYPVMAKLYDIQYKTIPLNDELDIDINDYQQPNGGIIFANPNAPTAKMLSSNQLETLLTANSDSVVVVDEAYVDFAKSSAVSLIDKYDNLVVVHTLSKSRSLAGMRVGYALAQPNLIEAIERVKNSFNPYPLDRIALAAGIASFQDREYFTKTCAKIVSTREALINSLETLGFNTLPSSTNFIFTQHDTLKAEYLFSELRKQKIIVRYFDKPRIDNFLRITVGTGAECDQLLLCLKRIINNINLL